jgi:hypothetical protein
MQRSSDQRGEFRSSDRSVMRSVLIVDKKTKKRLESAGPSSLLYQIEFTATDTGTGASCNGAVPVCVKGLFGPACSSAKTPSYDATKCP